MSETLLWPSGKAPNLYLSQLYSETLGSNPSGSKKRFCFLRSLPTFFPERCISVSVYEPRVLREGG